MGNRELADLHKIPYPDVCKSLVLNGFKLPQSDTKYMHLVWVERFIGDSDYIYTLCNYYQGKAYEVMNNKEVNLQHCAIYVAPYSVINPESCGMSFNDPSHKMTCLIYRFSKIIVNNGNFAQAEAQLYLKNIIDTEIYLKNTELSKKTKE